MPNEPDEAENLGETGVSLEESPPGATTPQPTPSSLAEMRARVRDLELEQMQLLTGRAAHLEAENRLLRGSSPALEFEPTSLMPGDQAPGYLARSLIRVEGHVADMEGSAAIGDNGAAAKAKVLAARDACSALTRLCDDDRFHEALERVHTDAKEHGAHVQNVISGKMAGKTPGNTSDVPPHNWFRTVEVQLLELSGLAHLLAEQHTDASIAEFLREPQPALTRLQNPLGFLRDVRSLRDTLCQSADLFSANLKKEESRRRWKRFVTYGLGGTLIVTVNAASTAVLGPAGVAASGAIGSAAVGAAASMVA